MKQQSTTQKKPRHKQAYINMVFYKKQMFTQFVKNELAESLKKVVNKLNKTDSVKDFLLPPN